MLRPLGVGDVLDRTFTERLMAVDQVRTHSSLRVGWLFLAGFSAGAYGSLDIGLRHPGLFGTLESWSGYFRAPHDGSLAGATAGELEQLGVGAQEASGGIEDRGGVWHVASLSLAGDPCLSSVLGLLRRGLGPGEEQVDLAARVAQDGPGLGDVCGISPISRL